MKRLIFLAGLLVAAAFAAGPSQADPKPRLPEKMRSIEAVNVEIPYAVVTGTVTVRARGVLVNPADVTYSFEPDFKASTGYLFPVADGTFVFRADRVPADRSHVLTIKATHNDTVIKNGLVAHLGQTYSGLLRIEIPLGRDYSFGEQLLDLR